jgi:hypothetical protein
MSTHHHIAETTARGFLERLRLSGPLFADEEPGAWIFRGQSNNEWELRASARRPENADLIRELAGPPQVDVGDPVRRRQGREKRVLAKLLDVVNRSGLNLQCPWEDLQEDLLRTPGEMFFYRNWPLWGIAQHFGLPSPLLDWTRLSLVAAYFAASGAVREL